MIKMGVWPTPRTSVHPVLTYRCPFCGNEDIAMSSIDFCGECFEVVPDVDLLYGDVAKRVYYYNHGECR